MSEENRINNTVKFISSKKNTGAVTVHYDKIVTLKKNGTPIKAGDIKAGAEITFNRITGEIE